MKVTVAQCNFIVADFNYNYEKIKETILKYNDSDLIVFSELCVIGYYPYDLLMYSEVLEAQYDVIKKIKILTKEYATAVVVGVFTEIPNMKKFHNSAIVIDQGKVVFSYHKKLIPSYGIFDERRHFISGSGLPFFKFRGNSIALFICEDIWFDNRQGYVEDPTSVLDGRIIDCVIVINASPSMINKFEQRQVIIKNIVRKSHSPIVYSSQIGGYDEVVYDGSSFIADENGNIVVLAKSFQEDFISMNIKHLPKKSYSSPYRNNYALILDHLILGLQDYLRKCRFAGVVIGSSGGIDSAITLVIATLALGKSNVKAITMPSIFSSGGSIYDSENLCNNLGVKLYYRSISNEFENSCKEFQKSFGTEPKALTKENIQARIRGRIIMEYSNNSNFLMLTTGNKSELATGYTTLYGDMCGALNCIGDLYKHDIYGVCRYINQRYKNIIPENILEKEPSAELSEGQKDSDSLPEYEVLDAMLKLHLEKDLLSKKEINHLKSVISKISIKKQRRIYHLIELNEFKRKQAPQILIIHNRPFGIGRRVPVTSAFQKNFA